MFCYCLCRIGGLSAGGAVSAYDADDALPADGAVSVASGDGPVPSAADRAAHGKFAAVFFDAAFPHGRHGRGDGRHQSACAILQDLFVTVEIVEYVAEILPRTGHVDRESESLRGRRRSSVRRR